MATVQGNKKFQTASAIVSQVTRAGRGSTRSLIVVMDSGTDLQVYRHRCVMVLPVKLNLCRVTTPYMVTVMANC